MWDAMERFLEPPEVLFRCIVIYGAPASILKPPEHGTSLGYFPGRYARILDAGRTSIEAPKDGTSLGCFPGSSVLILDAGEASLEAPVTVYEPLP